MPKKNIENIRDDILLHCADALYTHPGLDMVGLANQTGISRPKLYRYFSNRDDLLIALAMKSIQDIDDACSNTSICRVTVMRCSPSSFAAARPEDSIRGGSYERKNYLH